ncbi:unnamed protein product [Linum trigynum]|uniref:Alpha 1,4-glycosyltransferase domain-containing protein n=1 Tax=Linum trigynum TaxID=586398 RepID=A0AAV2FIS6_9ROSI
MKEGKTTKAVLIGCRIHHDQKSASLFLHHHVQGVKRFVLGFVFLVLLVYNGAAVFYVHVPFFPAVNSPANFSSSSEGKPGLHREGKKEKPSLPFRIVSLHALSEALPITRFPSPVVPTTAAAATIKRHGRKGHSLKWHVGKAIRKLEPRRGPPESRSGPEFTARIRDFFRSSDCNPRFFMTLISPSLDSLGDREIFAVESLFRTHRNACLVIISNSMDSEPGRRLLKRFADRNFHIAAVKPNFAAAFKGTPAEIWFRDLKSGRVRPGDVSLAQNLSNLLRLALLYKFGGIYLDTDVVVLRSFTGLRNAIGAQTVDVETGKWSRLNNAVLVFDRSHPLVYKFIEEFATTFDGSKWGHNGPYLVSRVVERVEGNSSYNFTVLPPPAFYPVDWSRISGLFQGPRDRIQSSWVRRKLERIKKESFAVHLWNRQSRDVEIEDGSVMNRIMTEYCIFCNSSSS